MFFVSRYTLNKFPFRLRRTEVLNPHLYVQYRNAVIDLYRQDPSRTLTFTEVREHLQGDVTGMLRVFEFLEKWGIINHRPDSAAAESLIPARRLPPPAPRAAQAEGQKPPPRRKKQPFKVCCRTSWKCCAMSN